MVDCCSIDILPIKKNTHSLVPISSGEERCKPLHSWGAGVRSYFLIHYVVSGKGVLFCGTERYNIGKGCIFTVFPGSIVKYVADEYEPWHYAWVAFRGEEAEHVLAESGITVKTPVRMMKNGDAIIEVIREMPSERGAELRKNLDFSARLYDFLSLIVSENEEDAKSENGYLTSATRYIKAHYTEDITVDQVASHIGISRKYLFAVFKRTLGVSPKDYIIDYRIKRAKEFLADKALPIGNIAYSVGYKDPLTFSRMFKIKTGLSPSEYRAERLK